MPQHVVRRARLDEALEALRTATQARADALRAAATANDSVDESACVESLTAETDARLASLGWSRAELISELAASEAAQALRDRGSLF